MQRNWVFLVFIFDPGLSRSWPDRDYQESETRMLRTGVNENSKKDCFNGWCKLAAGCMDCLHDRCGTFSNRCPSVSRYAPCYKTPSLPGCDMVAGDEMLKCGLGLACDRRLFNFIKGKLMHDCSSLRRRSVDPWFWPFNDKKWDFRVRNECLIQTRDWLRL